MSTTLASSLPTDPRALLESRFGFSEFRPGQAMVVDSLLAGRSALAVFPTGGGKSLCYQLPALMLDGVTVVISPLIALMKDQIDFLVGRGVAAARLDSTLSREETIAVGNGLAEGSLKLLYVAPERFHNERFLGQLSRTKVAMLAIDEAHCISEWGHNFRPDYLMLAKIARQIGAERVLALTATATPKVVKDIQAAFEIDDNDTQVTGFYRQNLRLLCVPTPDQDRDALLVSRLKELPPGPGIVYVTLQKTAERLAQLLAGAGLPAEAYHAGLDTEIRTAVQERWMASDRGIVVATIAFGMGIDKSDVRYVLHYNLPKSLESYSQEIGRAGRDGKESIVELLACPDDVPTLENFVYGDTPDPDALRRLIDDLLGRGSEFDVALYDWSSRHDIRALVLKTIFTYLELDGVVRQGTPFYAGYEFRPINGHTSTSIAASFPAPYDGFVQRLFGAAYMKKIWWSLNPDDAAMALGVERGRIVRVLDVLAERELAEVRASDVRQRFVRLRPSEDADALAATLIERFDAREAAEIKRLEQVLTLAALPRCRTNALAGYFGDRRTTPCGHCTFCETGDAPPLPAVAPPPPIPDSLANELALLQRSYPDALGSARQAARFLCGLTSPATTRARLGRHARFGALESNRFRDIVAWCESSPGQS